MNTSLKIVITLLLAILLLSSCRQAISNKKPRILLIHSFQEDRYNYKIFNEELIKTFKEQNISPELHIFYLDCESYLDYDERKRMYNYIDSMIPMKPDMILVNDDQATYSLMACEHPFVKTIPVVFAGVNYPNWDLLKKYPNITGLHDKQDFLKNVEFIHAIFGTLRIQVPYDRTALGKMAFVDVLKQLRPDKRIQFVRQNKNFTKYAMKDEEILPLIDSTKNDPLPSTPLKKDLLGQIQFSPLRVLYALNLINTLSNFDRPTTYLNTKYDYISEGLPKMVAYPSFSAHNEPVNYKPDISDKYLGGYFTSIETQAREQALMASKILNGTPISQLPVTISPKEYILIWEIMKTAGISLKKIPANVRIIDMPLAERYKTELIIINIIAFLIVTLIIFFLIRIYVREARYKRQAQEDLIQQNHLLEKAIKKSQESEQMKSAFLANMSHEIRTPLNAIVGFSNLLNSDMDLEPEERENFIGLINSNCDLLLSLINDILDLSRIESGRMAFNLEDYNLNDLLLEIHNVYKIMMPSNVELQIEMPKDRLILRTDKHRLMQVITNFLNNSIKFTQQGYIKIGYSHHPESKSVCIFVEDTGKGIAKDKQELIFGRFTKLDEFAKGTGLGLSICKVIVERLEGEIRVESEEGKGSRFMVDLPCLNTPGESD